MSPMRTDDLIAHLSEGLAPAPRGLVQRVLLLALAGGTAVSAAALLGVVHLNRDLDALMHTPVFWIKIAYTATLAATGFIIVQRQARAGADSRIPLIALLGPVVVMIVLASIQLADPDANSAALVMGRTWMICPWLIGFLALPLLAGFLLALRSLAPTRLTLAGAAAGLAAGATAATLYGFHCVETAAPFVLIWYTLGIVVCCIVGALAGPRVLRW